MNGMLHFLKRPNDERLVVVIAAIVVLAPFACLLLDDDRVLVPNGRVCPSNVYSDFSSYQLPVREYARKEYLAGRFPCWIANLGCGLPFHAGLQCALCYPLLTPLVLTLGTLHGIKVSIFLHFALCFVGQYALGRHLGISVWGACISASTATLGAFPITHVLEGHVSLFFGYCLAPWFFLTLKKHLALPTLRSCGLLATWATLLLLSGQPQMPYYIFLGGATWSLIAIVWGEAKAHRGLCIALLLLAIVIAGLLCAIQWLPTAELYVNGREASERGTIATADEFSLNPSDLFLFLWPNLKGNALLGIEEFSTFGAIHERLYYVGLIPIVLALLAILHTTASRQEVGFGALIAFCLIVSVGRHTFLFPVLLKIAPGLSLFRCPARTLGLASIFISLLAGKGADVLMQGFSLARPIQLLRLGIGLVPLALLFVGALIDELNVSTFGQYVEYAKEHLYRPAVFAVITFAVCCSALFVCRRLHRQLPNACYVLLLAVATGDGISNNCPVLNLQPGATPPVPSVTFQRGMSFRFFDDTASQPTVISKCKYSKFVNMALAENIGLIGTNEGGVLPKSTETLFRAIEQDLRTSCAMSGCSYIFDGENGSWSPLDGFLPRVRYLTDDCEDLVSIPLNRIGCTGLTRLAMSATKTQRDIEILGENSQEVFIRVKQNTAGTLVLADTFYPGWHCTVDGIEAPIILAHSAFRAVALPAGRHEVVFSFRPRSLQAGAILTLAGVMSLSLLMLITVARHFRHFAPLDNLRKDADIHAA